MVKSERPDCLIIGGGLVGMTMARELAASGASVQLLERGACGRESSWAGGGILSPLVPWDMPDAVSRLAQWSQRAYPALAAQLLQESGIDPQWTRSGLLSVDTSADDWQRARAWAAIYGMRIEHLGGAAVAAIEPACRPVREAIWLPGVAQVRNPRLLQALQKSLMSAGVSIREHAPVAQVLVHGGRVRGVRLHDGTEIEADRVIVAGGAWSGELLAPFAVGAGVKPVKGQMLLYQGEPGLLRSVLLHGGYYAVPRRDGQILFGSTLEDTGFDASISVEARGELSAAATALLPVLAELSLVRQWAGLRPGSPQGVPRIGPIPGIEGLFLNAGHYRNGVLLALGSARLLADLVLGRTPILPPAQYLPVSH
ncbi:MAG: glycine oxidase ThiO [Chromatiales bacterium]|jgi:glycine oxidase|nr:glycine oxidase ThiO [Chromatiales bacterium]